MSFFNRGSVFEKLSPEQRQSVIANVAQRSQLTHKSNSEQIANMLRNNDKATAQAMQYTGIEGYPSHMKEDSSSPPMSVHQLLDNYVDDTDGNTNATSTDEAAQVEAQANANKAANRSRKRKGSKTTNKNDLPVKKDSPEGSGTAKLIGGLAAVGLTLAGGVALAKKIKQGKATPEEMQKAKSFVDQGFNIEDLIDQPTENVADESRALVASDPRSVVPTDSPIIDIDEFDQITNGRPEQSYLPTHPTQMIEDQSQPAQAIRMPNETTQGTISLPDEAVSPDEARLLQEYLEGIETADRAKMDARAKARGINEMSPAMEAIIKRSAKGAFK